MTNELNIIILDYKEKVVKWLDPNLCEIKETSKRDACRKIELTYPYEEEVITSEKTLWYEQGNKIYVPGINGIKSCLYVINTDYEIDFWKDNTVKLEAEEVITELNNDVVYFPENTLIEITTEQLDTWFGAYYDILGIDTLNSSRKQVSPSGIMTRMSLLRLIEEQTGRVFLTDYSNENNHIERSLYLANPEDTRFISKTDTLDLNFNLESLEFTKSEEDTYNAMAPIFSNSSIVSAEVVKEKNGKISADILSRAELRTDQQPQRKMEKVLNEMYTSLKDQELVSGDGLTTESVTADDIIQDWLDYEVMEGQVIPMIIQEDEEGNIVSKANWNAPFEKAKGELYIKYNGNNQTSYTDIHPYNASKAPEKYKIGVENTNETMVEAIYNELALSLLNKLTPSYELEISVKDIQQLLGLNNLGYQLHETLQVRVPNFNYFLPCRITETVKNLHNPGENKIKIETEVTTIYNLQETVIKSENRIISANDTNDILGGTLLCDDKGLSNQYIVMSIQLVKAYTDNEISKTSNIQQSVKKFDPINEYYLFSEQQIANLEKAMRNDLINLGWGNVPPNYRLRDIDGNVYSVPQWWCASIYYARNQIYSNNELAYGGTGEEGLGKGFFDDTISVHYYPNAMDVIRLGVAYEEQKKYYASIFYDYHSMIQQQYRDIGIDDVGVPLIMSSERQNGPTCLPASISNITSLLKDYHTEYELSKLMGTTKENGTYRGNGNKVMQELGFKVTVVEATKENIRKYVGWGACASIDVDANKLGPDYFKQAYVGTEAANHAIIIYDWYFVGNEDDLYVAVMDTNIPVFNPAYLYGSPFEIGLANFVKWETIQNAINGMYLNNTWYISANNMKHMTIIEETTANLASVEEVTGSYIITPSFNPEVTTYKFNLDNINETVKNLLYTICNSNVDIDVMSSSSTITTASNVELENISMWWLRALLYAGMYYYQSHDVTTSNLLIEANDKSDSMKYYTHFNRTVDKIGDYDWFSPCNPLNTDNTEGYICATLLFYLGMCTSYMDYLPSNSYTSLQGIGKKVVNRAGKTNNKDYLNMFTVPLTSENIKKYLKRKAYQDNFVTTVVLTFAYSSTLNTIAELKSQYYPVMLYNVSGSNVDYMNILSKGNNLTSRYNTKRVDATSMNPFGTTTISDLISWNSDVEKYLEGGDKGTMLVISYYTKAELEAL